MGIVLGLLLRDFEISIVLLLYSAFIIFFLTKRVYEYLLKKGFEEKRAAYLNRKIVHISIGGIVSAIVPFVFNYPIVPSVAAWVLGFFLLYMRRASLMYWFQVKENAYEVNFAFAWGTAIFVLWSILGDPFLAMLPPMLVSFGDGVTGLVRNLLFKKRVKHWAGNLAMAAVMVPIGYIYAGPLGVVASLVASIVERYEFGIIDDNVLIVLASSLVIFAGKAL